MVNAMGGVPQDFAFPLDEYAERCRRLREVMREAGLDVMLVHQPPSVLYFSGNENLHVYDSECVIVPREGEVSLLVPQADLSRARLTSWVRRIETFPPGGEPGKVLAGMVADQGWARARIGVEKRVARAACLSVHTYETLCAALAAGSIRRRVRRAGARQAGEVPDRRSRTYARPPGTRTRACARHSPPQRKVRQTTTWQPPRITR